MLLGKQVRRMYAYLVIIYPFPKQALVFVSVVQVFWKHCGKRRNCSLTEISPFPTVFSTHFKTCLPFISNFKMWSAKSFSLEESKICRLGKGFIFCDKIKMSEKFTEWVNYQKRKKKRDCCMTMCSVGIGICLTSGFIMVALRTGAEISFTSMVQQERNLKWGKDPITVFHSIDTVESVELAKVLIIFPHPLRKFVFFCCFSCY